MEPLKGYNESFTARDGDIIKEVTVLPDGSELSREGASLVFYNSISGAGENFLFLEGDDYLICYIDHDDIIQSIDEKTCKFFLENGERRTIIIMTNKNGYDEINIPFTFSYDKMRDFDALRLIKKTGTFNVCFIAIAFGSFVKDRLIQFRLPENVMQSIPG